ncbi:Eukaryotic translation initiation factor 5B, partial [Fragariocoptes setiger]
FKMVHLAVLEAIKDVQSQHGLKYDNYQRYRSYCSRRLHRLRKSLNSYQGIPSSAKARHLRGRKLVEITNQMVVELYVKNKDMGERMLIIPLILAERSWAYAMQLKQEVGEHSRKKFHSLKRLKKAVQHGNRFEALCCDQPTVCDQRTKLEAQAYASYLRGLLAFEVQNYAIASQEYLRSMSIYFKLCLSIKEEDILLHYRQRIEEIKASMRYTMFNLDTPMAVKNENIPSKLQFHDLALKHIRHPDSFIDESSEFEEPLEDAPAEPEMDEDEEHFDDAEEDSEQPESRIGGAPPKKDAKKDPKKAAAKKGPSKAMLALIKQQQAKFNEEEERLKREEEERIRQEEEERRQKEEAERKAAERKAKKKQKEKERKERLKKEGRLLTDKQRADRKRALETVEIYKKQLASIADGTSKVTLKDKGGDESDSGSDDSEASSVSGDEAVVSGSTEPKDELRSPVICVLGHVDTGKTKLLDFIRRTHVQDNEAGGITQQIGATFLPKTSVLEHTKYVRDREQLNLPGLLVIDTPGHESFTNLRSRGSSLCDIAILVIDIMHGLEQQTIESINLLKERKTPFLVALNKIDRLYDWKSNPKRDVEDTLKAQPPNTKIEFQHRSKEIILQLNKEGLNASLYYENPDTKAYVSLVPTSAVSGDGMGNLISLLVWYSQTKLSKKLIFRPDDLDATVFEVKALPGLGTTIDVILINGVLKEGDRILLAGYDGPIVTHVRALLVPHPNRESRVKSQYNELKVVKGSIGVKITGHDLDKAIAGLQLHVVKSDAELERLKSFCMAEFANAMKKIKCSDKGVYVQASTLGSLEALLEFLKQSKIPYSNVRIGPVVRKDVMKISTMLETAPNYACILAFDVTVERAAQELADSLGIKIFQAEIIYHLFDKFTAHIEELKRKQREQFKDIAVFPCKLKILPQYIFNKRDPIVIGVIVEDGVLVPGTPLYVPAKSVAIGRVTSMQLNHKEVESARKGDEICIKIENTGDAPRMIGRHFEETDQLLFLRQVTSINSSKMGNKSSIMLQDEEISLISEETGFSPPQIERLYARFTSLDKGDNGSLSVEDFLRVPELAINPLCDRIVQMFFADCDVDHDRINFRQFMKVLATFRSSKSTRHSRQENVNSINTDTRSESHGNESHVQHNSDIARASTSRDNHQLHHVNHDGVRLPSVSSQQAMQRQFSQENSIATLLGRSFSQDGLSSRGLNHNPQSDQGIQNHHQHAIQSSFYRPQHQRHLSNEGFLNQHHHTNQHSVHYAAGSSQPSNNHHHHLLDADEPPNSRKQKLYFLFKIYDVDNDDKISLLDLKQVIKMMVGTYIDDAQLNKISERTFREIDKDSNGFIDFEEFCEVFAAIILSTYLGCGPILQPTCYRKEDFSLRWENNNVDWNYAVITDCGSSGTRAHIYKWKSNRDDKDDPLLLHAIEPERDYSGKELTFKITPGLSSVEDDPEKASEYMTPVMEFISKNIPEEKHHSTPIYFLATAGLRLLDKSTQRVILDDLKDDLSKRYGFPNIQAQVITGKQEAIYSWIAVNSKAKRFDVRATPSDGPPSTIGVIEMGGASSQVSWQVFPHDEKHKQKVYKSKETQRALSDAQVDLDLSSPGHEHKYKLFATTFLGAGTNSVREAAIDLLVRNIVVRKAVINPYTNSIHVSDPCLPKGAIEDVKRPAEVAWSQEELIKEYVSRRKNFFQSIGFKLDDDKPTVDVKLKGSGNFPICLHHLRQMLQTAKLERWNCIQGEPCSLSLLGLKNLVPFKSHYFYGLSELYYTTNEMVGMPGVYRNGEMSKKLGHICRTKYEDLLIQYKDSNKHDKQRVLHECFKGSWLMIFLVDGLGYPVESNYLTTI